MIYHFLCAYTEGHPRDFVVGSIFGCLAFLIKALDAFYFIILLPFIIAMPNLNRTLALLIAHSFPVAFFSSGVPILKQ